MGNETRGPGRPPILTDAEREQRRIENNKRRNNYHKEAGYAAQKKYQKGFHFAKIPIPLKLKPVFDDLLAETGMTEIEFFMDAVEKQYGISLREIDKKDND